MAQMIIIKRGNRRPTTVNLTRIGEIAFDYISDKLYVRSVSTVECINNSAVQPSTK